MSPQSLFPFPPAPLIKTHTHTHSYIHTHLPEWSLVYSDAHTWWTHWASFLLCFRRVQKEVRELLKLCETKGWLGDWNERENHRSSKTVNWVIILDFVEWLVLRQGDLPQLPAAFTLTETILWHSKALPQLCIAVWHLAHNAELRWYCSALHFALWHWWLHLKAHSAAVRQPWPYWITAIHIITAKSFEGGQSTSLMPT